MNKRASASPVLILIAIVALCLASWYFAIAGAVYGPVVYMDDVSMGSWTSVIHDIDVHTTNGTSGTYTNGTYTNTYRMSGTNLNGRLPLSTNLAIVFVGNTNGAAAAGTNAVVLAWDRYDGIASYIVERSYDAGATWTNYMVLGATVTNWTDTGTNIYTYTNAVFTNDHATAIAAPTGPWSGLIKSNASYAMTAGTVAGLQAATATGLSVSGTMDAGGVLYVSNSMVGIGTSAPSAALTVNGTVGATAFAGDGSGLTGIPGATNWSATPALSLVDIAGNSVSNALIDGDMGCVLTNFPVHIPLQNWYPTNGYPGKVMLLTGSADRPIVWTDLFLSCYSGSGCGALAVYRPAMDPITDYIIVRHGLAFDNTYNAYDIDDYTNVSPYALLMVITNIDGSPIDMFGQVNGYVQ